MEKLGRRIMARTRLRSGNVATSDAETLHGEVDPVTVDTGVTGDTGDTLAVDIGLGITV